MHFHLPLMAEGFHKKGVIKMDIEKLKKAGAINREVLELGKKLIRPGNKVLGVVEELESYIKKKADLAFPVNLSFNETAAHDTADVDDKRTIPDDAVVKLDVGTHVDGNIADSAITIDLSKKYSDLVKASEDALKQALKLIKPGVMVKDIGKTIYDTITSYNLSPVVNLSGHQIDEYQLHTGLTIPNIPTESHYMLEEDDVVAIEPFVSTGAGNVYESGQAKIFMLQKRVPVRLQTAKQLLDYIENEFQGLPFSFRQLYHASEFTKIDKTKIPFAFSLLKKQKCFVEFPPLVDRNKGMVSQAEHTVIVKDKPIITTKE